jgi:uncharacterized protein DUF3574
MPLRAMVLILAMGLAACVQQGPACRNETQLFFGTAIPTGGEVSDEAWADFLAASVTPRFPDGFTVTDGYGQWRDTETQEIVVEESRIVAVLHDGGPESDGSLNAIAKDYAQAFHQQSVMRVDGCAAYSFIGP